MVRLCAAIAAASALASPALAIIGGIPECSSQYSYVAALMQPAVDSDVGIRECTSFMCTAVLISPTAAITAAECVEGVDPSTVKLRVGLTPQTQHNLTISAINVMPGFNMTSLENDIALLTLANKTDVKPAKLSTTISAPTMKFSIMGWGPTCPTEQKIAPQLHWAYTHSILDKKCAAALKPCFSLDAKERLCISATNSGEAAYGDAGGPVVDAMGHVVAIMTGSPSCAAGDGIALTLKLEGQVAAFIKTGAELHESKSGSLKVDHGPGKAYAWMV